MCAGATDNLSGGSRERDLILREHLPDEEVRQLLSAIGFSDWRDADRRLQRLAGEPPDRLAFAEVLSDFLLALRDCADCDMALNHFARFVELVSNRLTLFRYLASDPRTLETLITIFAGSQFLSEILLRNPEYFDVLADRDSLPELKTGGQLRSALATALAPFRSKSSQLNAARRFQRFELLRVGACDLLGLWDLTAVTEQLSALADALVEVCLAIASETRNPQSEIRNFLVIALGKLGGGELNYSSDIDLLFLSRGAEDYRQLGADLIEALSATTEEGFLYRVDMRLRPWGRAGALVPTLDGYFDYLRRDAALWERQALLKTRPLAGDISLGTEFARRVEGFIYNDAPEELLRADVAGMKRRIEESLRQRGREAGHVKLGSGSIRDVEFVAQYLQLAHGGRLPQVRSGNTLTALERLGRHGLLSPEDGRVLREGYVFLRTVEHRLQMMAYQQIHELPRRERELERLALRTGFSADRRKAARDRFLEDYQRHSAAVRDVFERVIGAGV